MFALWSKRIIQIIARRKSYNVYGLKNVKMYIVELFRFFITNQGAMIEVILHTFVATCRTWTSPHTQAFVLWCKRTFQITASSQEEKLWSQISAQVELHVYRLQKTIRAYWSKRRVETNGSFQIHPKSFRDSHYMVLPQTFLYRISTMQSFKSYLYRLYNKLRAMMYFSTHL